MRIAFLGIGLLSCAGRWRRSRARSVLLQRECVFLALGRLRMLPEIAVVITVDAGHGMVLRVHAHAHLSQVVGQDGGNGPECGVVLQAMARGGSSALPVWPRLTRASMARISPPMAPTASAWLAVSDPGRQAPPAGRDQAGTALPRPVARRPMRTITR